MLLQPILFCIFRLLLILFLHLWVKNISVSHQSCLILFTFLSCFLCFVILFVLVLVDFYVLFVFFFAVNVVGAIVYLKWYYPMPGIFFPSYISFLDKSENPYFSYLFIQARGAIYCLNCSKIFILSEEEN